MPTHRRFAIAALLAAAVVGLSTRPAGAQGVTTAAITGIVTSPEGQPLEGAQVKVTNTSTGFSTGTITHENGRFNVQGLEVGGPYTIAVRRIGFQPQERAGINLTLGQNLRADFQLTTQAVQLSGVTVIGRQNAVISSEHVGAATMVSDSALRRLPTLNRNFTDFVALAPQISVSGPGQSGGGVNNRYNNIQIDGTLASDVFGLGSTGQPGGQAGGKVIPLDAVKEYQVLLTPFDVRQGNFAGALVNAVTKSGTNEFHGSGFFYTRNQSLARSQDYLTDYSQQQYGFSVGGPIVKDRAHFFVAPEFTRYTSPAFGPYLGSNAPIDTASVQRFQQLLTGYGIQPGSAGLVNNENPLNNVFARFDFAQLPYNTRAVVSYNYSKPTKDVFSRSSFNFPLSSNGYKFYSTSNKPTLQLFTNFASGALNEFSASVTTIRDSRTPNSVGPQITVHEATANLIGGAERYSQGNALDQDIWELKDDYTFPVGDHRITVGTSNQFYKIRNLFSRDSYGVWDFGDLDSLQNGLPYAYSVGLSADPTKPISSVAVHMKASQYAVYAQDAWQPAGRNFTLTYGLRLDIPVMNSKPGFFQRVDSVFGRNTSDVPSGNVQWSPRIGFNWDVTGDQRNQLRGGVGMFVGRPAFVWLSNAYQNSGTGLALLSCGSGGSAAGPVPVFSADPNNPPATCANGAGVSSYRDEIDLLSKDLKFPQTLRGTVGYDRALPYGFVGTLEGIYTRNINDFFYINRNLRGVQGTDAHGRVMYGTIAASGFSSPAKVDATHFGNVIDVINTNENYSYNLTAQLQRRFANNFEMMAAYTFSRARDAQSPTSSQAISNWRYGRDFAGNLLDKTPGVSAFDQPHKVVLAGTYSFPTQTAVSLYYVGQSGMPYDYVYGGRGDRNADGVSGNDLFYVPTEAEVTNQTELVFQQYTSGGNTITAAQQATALNSFINSIDCLSSARGKILDRNSCRTKWQNIMNLTVRQSLPRISGQTVSLELGVFNVLNLLNKNWGQFYNTPGGYNNINIVDVRGTATTTAGSVPLVRFDPGTKQFDTNNVSSNYQIQLAARYSF